MYGQAAYHVPETTGSPVLIDGQFSPGEWEGASEITISDAVTLLLQQRAGHVFLGIKTPPTVPRYIDLFVHVDDALYNLHASAQVGERLLADTTWSDAEPPWRWGNHVDWIANEVKADPTVPRDEPWTDRLFPYEGFEFQLRRARFVGPTWQVRIEVRDFMGTTSDIIFPSASQRKDTTHWLRLHLDA